MTQSIRFNYNVTMTIEQLESHILSYPARERLRLDQLLLDSLQQDLQSDIDATRKNPLLKWAGVFDAEPVDGAERADEILLEAIDSVGGFSNA